MEENKKRICVFCGSQTGNKSNYSSISAKLGSELVTSGFGLVYGGGNVGLMGVIADAVLEKKGEVLGVIPGFLKAKEVAHKGVTKMWTVTSMHERKALMERLSCAFIALPGGFGTLDELCEIITWFQLGLHKKPIGLLNEDGFFDPLIQMFDRSVTEGFIKKEHREMLIITKDPVEMIQKISAAVGGAT